MKKLLSLLLTICMLLTCIGGLGVYAEETVEVTKTYGLDNLNDETGEIKVAFIGGSITYGQSADPRSTTRYSTQVVEEFFKTKFPNKTVTEINAGVGGTPSDYGAYRLGKDVSVSEPDVVFVEFAVNDWYRDSAEIRASMESIVRQLNDLPKVPVIIFLYTHKEGTTDAVKESTKAGLENAITAHQKVASYYGIGSVNIHEYIESLETAGTHDWYNGTTSGCLSTDATHPNTEGHNIYAEYITKCLTDNYSTYFRNPKARNAQLEQTVMLGNPTTVFYADALADGSAVATGTWTDSEELEYLQTGSHDWVIHPENLNSTWVQASSGGETMTYTFTGRSIGLAYGTIYQGATISYIIDEGTASEKSGTLSCNIEAVSPGTADAIRYTHRFNMLATDLEYGEHTVKLINTADGDNTNIAFSHFLVDTEEPVIGVDDVPAYVFDHTPSGEMPANLVTDGTYNAARTFYAKSPRNSNYVTLGNTTDKWISSTTGNRYDTKTILAEPGEADIAKGYEKIDLPDNTTSEFAGYWLSTGMLSISSFDADKSYVVSFKAKNAGTTENVRFGVGMSNYSTATESYTKEYGAEGMLLTSEYQTFNGTIKPSSSFNTASAYQGITLGMIDGTKTGSLVHIDLTDDNAVYLAEEQAYAITNTQTSGEKKLLPGAEATFKAEVTNQLGLTGYLNQQFTWYAMDVDRTEFIDGIEITPSADTTTATVTVSEDVESGTYAIVAVADDYSIAMGSEIFVVGAGYYNDYVKGEKAENILAVVSTNNSWGYASRAVHQGKLRTSSTITLGAEGTFSNDSKANPEQTITLTDAAGAATQFGFDGLYLSNTNDYLKGMTTINPSKNYVFSAVVKNSAETDANVGLAISNRTAATVSYSKEYGNTGMKLTSEYQEFKATIKPSSAFSSSADNVITIGVPEGTAAGTKIYIKTDTPDAVYFAEEQAYDITNTKVSGDDKLVGDATATFKAEVVNQVGLPGYLNQNFTWYAMNLDRTEIIDAITVTPSADTTTATVSLSGDVETGKYVIVAISEDYNIAKGAEIYAVGADYYKDYVPSGEKPKNILVLPDNGNNRGSAARAFQNGLSADNDVKFQRIETTWVTAAIGYSETNVWTDVDIVDSEAFGYNGVSIKNTGTYFTGMESLDPQKSYVFSAKVKNMGTTEAKVGLAMSNETVDTVSYSKEYPYGSEMAVGAEYTDFITTIKPSENFDSTATNVLTIGFPEGTKAGTTVYFDTSTIDSPYFAEEVASNITVTADGATTLSAGGSVKVSAEIVNQLGLTGYLNQDVEWYVMNTDRTEFIEGLTVTENEDGTATVTADENTALGTYAVVAVSENYDMVKGVEITVTEKQEEISALTIGQSEGIVVVEAKVENSKAETISFIFAAYKNNVLVKVESYPVTVSDGVAKLAQTVLNGYAAYENDTIVKAFVWDGMRPISNNKNLETQITVNTAQ